MHQTRNTLSENIRNRSIELLNKHLAALIELGDPAGRAELTHYTVLAEGLGHARGRWGALSRRAALAGISGRIDDAIGLADAALPGPFTVTVAVNVTLWPLGDEVALATTAVLVLA